MDKLFSRKRSASIAARHKDQLERTKGKDRDAAEKPDSTLKKAATTAGNRGEALSEKRAGKRKEAVDAAFGLGDGSTRRPTRVGDKAPSLDVDIRTSLIMPGLSQRFSVLLPKLSSAPETSLRSLLASQRERSDGPSLTLEEEEMLFAEMRATHRAPGSSDHLNTDDWDGQPPTSSADAWRNHSQGYLARSNISASTSSPSILSLSSDSTVTAKDKYSHSPPPTSSSFSSFQTFGGSHSQSSQRSQPRSYGFSGGSGMRDDTYLRKVASSKNLSGSVSSRKSGKSVHSNQGTSPPTEPVPLALASAERGTDVQGEQEVAFGPADTEHTPTSSANVPNTSASLAFPPLPDTPDGQAMSSGSWSKRAKRQSHLAALTTSQQKRISRALLEIDHELRRDGNATQLTQPAIKEEEEILEPEPEEDEDNHEGGVAPGPTSLHQRHPSYPDSEASVQSQHSAPFPYGISPAKSEKAVIEPPSPTARLPPSPRSHNLKAQVEGLSSASGDHQDEIPPLNLARKLTGRSPHQYPTPILTPSRTQPIKHTPSPSTSPSAVSPVPGYIPGQPRPVGSLHRSEGSVSSRSATPTNHTPTTTAPTSAQSSASIKGHLRAGSTPTHQHPPIASRSSSLSRSRSVNQGPDPRFDNDESPSKGVSSNAQSQTAPRLLIDRDAPTSRRPSSLLSVTSPPIIEEEGEDAHGLSDSDSGSMLQQPMPNIRVIPQRKEMAQAPHDHQQHIQEARDALGWNFKSGKGVTSRVVSEQGFIDGSTESGAAPSSALMHDAHMRAMSPDDWKRTLREAHSRQSLSSDYAADEPSEAVWGDLFTPPNSSSDVESLQTPTSAPSALSDTLRKLAGVGKEELAEMQDRLVTKAKAERQAIRDDSPVIGDAPVMQPAGSLPKRSASLARGQSPLPPSHLGAELPPSAWRRPSAERSNPSPAPSVQPTPPKSLAGLFTPPSTATPTGTAETSQPTRQAHATVPEPIQPPLQTPSAEGHDEIVYTPQSDPLSRKTSSAAATREIIKVPLEEDPEVRRDFEARIAAATAALNRKPSLGGSKLERKPTKKGAAIVISSPKLVSSSANVTATPLTPPESSIDPAMRKALDKTSGTAGGKSTGRWRKLGFRRGPSLSNQVPSAEQPHSPPPPTPPMASITPTLGATPATEKKLEEAIDLPAGATISPDLDNFKFPPLANRTQKNPALRDRPISPPMPYQPAMQQVVQPPSALMRAESDRAARPRPPAGAAADTVSPPHSALPLTALPAAATRSGTHSHSSSSNSAVAKFLESGRALGLNQEQLDQMLLANGMLDRSATTASSRSYQSTAPTTTSFSQSGHSHTRSDSQPKQATLKQSTANKSEDKPKGGLLRAFSKSRKTKTTAEAHKPLDSSVSKPDEPIPVNRNVVVRRTILMAHDEVKLPTTPTMLKTPSTVAESPDMSRAATGRKQSIKRKPLNLTREDHELVSSSPPAHRRNFSTGTTYSNRSDGQPEPAGPGVVNKGLGFLHPLGNSTRSIVGTGSSLTGISESPGDRRRSSDSRRRSSTGGSLYDLYGDDSTGQDSQEFLKPEATPERRTSDAASGRSAAGNPAVEICEYADGRVVWAVVDGLRDDDELPNADYSFSSHSRNDSFASNDSSSQNDRAGPWPGKANSNTPALNFRHRDRGQLNEPRPERFVYRADTRDVADLIDHLSRDLDPSREASRGRIDFSHLGPEFGAGQDDGNGTTQSSPFPYSTTQSRQGQDDMPSSPDPRFADPPSPEPTTSASRSSPHRSPPPPPIFAPPATAHVPAGGFSPKRQMMLRQGFGAHRANMHLGGSVVKDSTSPSGVSFSSSNSGGAQRTVEERLQDLLDRLKRQNEQDAARTTSTGR